MKLLIEAQSIMERDALVASLKDAGIESQAEHRDLSRKITNNTVDFSYEGVSILQNGFKVSVLDEDYAAAKAVLSEFQKRVGRPSLIESGPSDHFSKFYFASFFSIFVVVIPITFPMAVFHFIQAMKENEKISSVKLLVSLICLSGSLFGLIWLIYKRLFI